MHEQTQYPISARISLSFGSRSADTLSALLTLWVVNPCLELCSNTRNGDKGGLQFCLQVLQVTMRETASADDRQDAQAPFSNGPACKTGLILVVDQRL